LNKPARGTPFATAADCEAAFYRAFRRGDLEAMAEIWDASEDVICVHPAALPLSGRNAVMQSWQDILGTSGGVQVRFDCRNRADSDGLAVHAGIEIIGPGDRDPALVTVTNVYALTSAGWKMRGHHAAPVHRAASPRGAVH
jgi:ketosteroid isomerase-like protein